MILDPRAMPTKEVYRFLIAAVVPRPIAFVSTVSAAGVTNLAPFSYFNAVASEPPLEYENGARFVTPAAHLAPFSYFNAVASEPPLVAIAISDRPDDPKDTLRNVRETRE